MYSSIAIAANSGSDLQFYGYDGDIPILQQMKGGPAMADILLSGKREGWNSGLTL